MTKERVIIFILMVTLAIVLLKKCNSIYHTIETVKYDTTYVKVKVDTFYIPQIINHYTQKEIKELKWDTLYVENIEIVDTAAILQDYLSYNLYQDTLKNKYGYILVNDTIHRNAIFGRRVTTNLSIPEITKTITLTQPLRRELWVGGGLGFGNNINSYEFTLDLKDKKNNMIGLAWQQVNSYPDLFKLQYRRKISLRK